jgi:YHS domain-containing protein
MNRRDSPPPSTTIMKARSILIAALAILTLPALRAEEPKKQAEPKNGEVAGKEAVKPYPLDTCIVSDEKLGEMGKPFVFVHNGQEIKLCCKKCRSKFDKDPASYLKKLEGK